MNTTCSVLVPSGYIGEVQFYPDGSCEYAYFANLYLDGVILGWARGTCIHDIMELLDLGDGYKLSGDYYKIRAMMRNRESFTLKLWQEAIVK